MPNIDLVLLLDVPPSLQSLFQRIGRIRGATGTILVFDRDDIIKRTGLASYLAQPPEPNTLYMGNEYIAYAAALCAAKELGDRGLKIDVLNGVEGWDSNFISMVANELTPLAPVPDHLFPLKQRATTNSPHREFPLRGAIEPSYQVQLRGANYGIGTLSLSQRLREAFPGAVYGYNGNAFRVIGGNDSTIFVDRERNPYAKTSPNLQSVAFPTWTSTGRLWITSARSTGGKGFIARIPLQIAERVIGFTETLGRKTTSQTYEPGSTYAQRPLARVFPTTGVVFTCGSTMPECAGVFLLRAYAQIEGIHLRDLGMAPFHSRIGPTGGDEVKGIALYDTALGGLDLTRNLAEKFADYLDEAINLAQLEGASGKTAVAALRAMKKIMPFLVPQRFGGVAHHGMAPRSTPNTSDGWIEDLIAPGETAFLGTGEVKVIKVLYGRDGLRYQLEDPNPGVYWTVPQGQLIQIPGSRRCRFHLDTSEIQIVA
jgi:DEAD/DEAH box helicase domain-containing protein